MGWACGADRPQGALDGGAAVDAAVTADAGRAADAGRVADAAPRDAGTAGMDATTPTDAGSADGGGSPDAAGSPWVTVGGDRPANMRVPAGYDGSPRPLVILLHGYTVNGSTQDFYFGLSNRADDRNFFLITPDGTQEASATMARFWNATSACCNFYGSEVDDVAYLTGLIDEASARYAIDPDRVHLVGHSNGGFMSYRMACDVSSRIASIVSLAGATHSDEGLCDGAGPVSVLQIHGTADTTILYSGVAQGIMQYPGAEETVRRWAARAGCALGESEDRPRIDLDSALAGDDTDVIRYRSGCATGIDVELWRLVNGGHIPTLQRNFADRVLDFLDAHPRP